MKYGDILLIINKIIQENASMSNHTRSYIHIISPYEKVKLNITGSFCKAIKKEEKIYKKYRKGFEKGSAYSFGIISSYQFQDVKKELYYGNTFKNINSFNKYVKKYYELFQIDDEEFQSWISELDNLTRRTVENYNININLFKQAFLARCILQAVRCFGVKIELTYNQKVQIDKMDISNSISCDMELEYDKSKQYWLKIYGYPVGNEGKKLSKILNKNIDYFYSNKQFYHTRYSAIYSGTIPRILKMKYVKPTESNISVGQLELMLGKTSYMTLLGMARYSHLNHPFMQFLINDKISYKDINCLYDLRETNLVNEYIKESKYNLNENKKDILFKDINKINMYLGKSLAPHNLNVSANIITSDQYCVFTKRNLDMSDSKYIYCSVNGGAEIYDKNIGFYKNKAELERPTIKCSKSTIYFSDEIQREATEELGVCDKSNNWNYLGVSVMAGKPYKDSRHRVWLHFNILAEKNCLDKLEDVICNKETALESYENSNVYGYKIKLYNSKHEYVKGCFKSIWDFFYNNKDFFMYMIILLFSIENLDIVFSNSFTDIFTFSVSAIFLLGKLFAMMVIFFKGSKYIQKKICFNTNNISSLYKSMNYFYRVALKSERFSKRISYNFKNFWYDKNIYYKENIGPEFMLLSMMRLLECVE